MNHTAFDIPGHTVVRKLGEGGVGTVYLATDNMLQRSVAVKVLKSGVLLEEESMQRFQSEAITLARLRHPNITMLYNLMLNGGRWYMIMEYVEGETLEALLKTHGALPAQQVLLFAIQALDGLQHAHTKGVIHRDLKPSNLMLSVEGEIKIMDFGIARISGVSRLTRVGQAVGTPHYMSPEQVRGQEGNHASDIYSFGIVLYELLTGVTPFDSQSEYEIMHAHTSRRPVPPISLNPDIPETLNNAIIKALSKNPSQRFESAYEFKQCLQEINEQIKGGYSAKKPLLPNSFNFKLPSKLKLSQIPASLKSFKLPATLKSFKLKNWKFPVNIDRQYIVGLSFLILSFVIALIVIIYYSNPSEPIKETLIVQNTKIEVDPDTDMDKLMRQEPVITQQNIPTNIVIQENKEPSQIKPAEKEKKETKPAIPTEKENKTTAKVDNTKKPEVKNEKTVQKTTKPAVDTKKEKVTPAAKSETATLEKIVVIPRGTNVDLIMDNSFDYASGRDRSRITLTVASSIEQSGVTVIAAGAKAYAYLRKSRRTRSLEFEMLEVESVTGQKLKSMRTIYKSSTIQQGAKFKMTLDYNRLILKK